MDSNNQHTAALAPLIDVKGLSAALTAFAAERDWNARQRFLRSENALPFTPG